MTGVLTYNILLGGTNRVEELTDMISSANPDIVALVEATNADVVAELAQSIGMQFRLTGKGRWMRDWQLAVLTRLPILSVQAHARPGIFTRRHLLEVCVENTAGSPLTVFVVHQTSDFLKGQRGVRLRRAEMQEIIRIMQARAGKTPHLLMGDFNSLAPGETLQADVLLRYILREPGFVPSGKQALMELTARRRSTFRNWTVRTLMRIILGLPFATTVLNSISPMRVQGGIDLLLEAGYIDCYRHQHPDEQGYTFPAIFPACRIDYIFANPNLAARLRDCEIVSQGN